MPAPPIHPMTPLRALALVAGWLIVGVGGGMLSAAAQAEQAGGAAQEDLRITLLTNFSRYAEWPQPYAPRRRGAWLFCVDDTDPALVRSVMALEGQQLDGLAVQVAILRPVQAVPDCHALFLSAGLGRASVQTWLAAAQAKPVLTVSDFPEFSNIGGMIELVLERGRYGFDVDYSRVLAADMRLDSAMLKLARRVR